MTAIYGLWRFDGGDVTADFDRMGVALERYGADDHDVFTINRSLALGRHLHRSLPEDCFSASSGDRYVVVGDVRLTEREDLAAELNLEDGAATMSDAAIAAVAIERWHEEAFNRIYGAFAIAAWDKHQKRLLLARDHLGLKPLFFHSGERFFAFASMPGGLRAIPAVPRGADIDSMKRFLALESHRPERTHFEGIGRVMPGHFAVASSHGLSQSLYWKPDLTPLRLPAHQDYVDALSSYLDRAVAAALRGTGSCVGAHLSSGFDSSAVATTAARQLASRGGTVVAYTAAPREGYEKTLPNRLADESGLAATIASIHPNMEHVVVRPDRTPLTDLARTSSIYGGPVLNICNEPWYVDINDDAAGRGISIMLEGANGNATISETGMLALPELVMAGRIGPWLGIVAGLVRRGKAGWADVLWKSFNSLLPDRVYGWLMQLRFGRMATGTNSTALKDEYLSAVTLEAVRDYRLPEWQPSLLSGGWIRPSGNSLTNRLILHESSDSGAASKGMLGEWKIDYRDPTADRRLVEFTLRVPVEQFIHGGQPKALLRKVLAGRVPPQVLDNRLRGYQSADWHERLNAARQEVDQEVAQIEEFEPAAEIIDVERLKRLLDEWPDAGSDLWTGYSATLDYRSCLLRAISAASFMRQAARNDC